MSSGFIVCYIYIFYNFLNFNTVKFKRSSNFKISSIISDTLNSWKNNLLNYELCLNFTPQ